jgi:hypothetical protein
MIVEANRVPEFKMPGFGGFSPRATESERSDV